MRVKSAIFRYLAAICTRLRLRHTVIVITPSLYKNTDHAVPGLVCILSRRMITQPVLARRSRPQRFPPLYPQPPASLPFPRSSSAAPDPLPGRSLPE